MEQRNQDVVTNIISSKNLHKVFHESKSKLKQLHNKYSQRWFLDQCLDQDLIPSTFRLRNKPSIYHSEVSKQLWEDNLSQSSQNLIKIARLEVSNRIDSLFKQSVISSKKLLDQLGLVEKSHVLIAIESHERKVFQSFLASKRKKLKHLQNISKKHETHNPPRHIPSEPIVTPPPTKKKKNRPGKNKRIFLKKLREQQKKIQPNVVFNFSSQSFDESTMKLLSRGLNFAVKTIAPTKSNIKADCKQFARKMLWKEHFYDNSQQNFQPSIFKSEKTNLPGGPTPRYLTAFLNATETNLCDKSQWNKKHMNPSLTNIPQDEYKALMNLRKLQNDRVITIKPADKGSGICILNFKDYVESCENHLNSTQPQTQSIPLPYYSLSNESEVKKSKKDILQILEEGKQLGWINNSEFKAMDPTNKGLGKFYQIFKVHKHFPEGSLPPSRPIINGIDSITENISKFVDHHTRTLVQSLPTYLEDTRDFLQMLEEVNEFGGLPNDAILVTIDVTALYTNIKKEDAISAMKQVLDERQDQTIPSHFILELLRLIFSCNYFEFGSKIYKQNIGTAMGTPSAPNTAGITMGKHIDPKLIELANRLHSGPGDPIRRLKRFLDDLFMIWMGDIETLENFLNEINMLHPTLKFTYSYTCPFPCDIETPHDCFCYSSRSIQFLDTLVTIKNEKLITDLYRKPTDRCQYLLPTSSHPPHVIKNIPYSLCHRLVRICSEEVTLNKRFQELKGFLLSRQYDEKLIDRAILKATQLDRKEALRKVPRVTTSRPVFVTTYHPALPPITKILKNAWKVMVDSDNHLKNVFPKPPMVAYKQPNNSSLRQILIKSKLPQREKRIIPGLKKCNRPNCNACPFIKEGSTITSSNDKKVSVKLTSEASCDTENIVYCITCNKSSCKFIQYIGESKRSLKTRFYEHINYVRKGDITTPIGAHFILPGHNESNMTIQILEHCKNKSTFYRKTRETYYINLFESARRGLNRQF